MLAYLTKSIVGAVVVLLVMSFIVFCLQSIIPADPARAIAGPSAPPETVEAMREQLGLDDPVCRPVRALPVAPRAWGSGDVGKDPAAGV